jgi:predicted Zn-dependent protease
MAAFLVVAGAAAQGSRKLKPGFNLFSKAQDVQLGKEAAGQIEKETAIVSEPQLNDYVRRIGDKLAATPEAGGFPYSFKVVSDKSINAFALPGGPTFLHTGLLAAAENEAQIAGVLAHEISHVALRHGTNQASKANLIQLPATLAAAAAGRSGSLLGNLAQLGIGLGANSVLLRFSRDAERDADLLGTRIMARVGYNPVEMARFFEKLEAGGGGRGLQFFSDHPNPGNRVKAVEAEIRYLPGRTYTTGDAGEFTQMQKRVAALPPPPPRPRAQPVPALSTSGAFREHRSTSYAISYPDNWQVIADKQAQGATIAPKEGLVQSGSGTAIGAGMIIGFQARSGAADLRGDTENLIRQLASSNPGMKAQGSKETQVDGQPALLVTLHSESPYAGETEIDSLVTVERPEGLFHVILITPQSALAKMQGAFDSIIRSIRFVK